MEIFFCICLLVPTHITYIHLSLSCSFVLLYMYFIGLVVVSICKPVVQSS